MASGGVALAGRRRVGAAAAPWLNRLLLSRMETLPPPPAASPRHLSARTEIHPKGDVFDRLGEAMNGMLDRIEELMTGMRTVTDSLRRPALPLTRCAPTCHAMEPAPMSAPGSITSNWPNEADRSLATSARWTRPRERTVREMMALSI